MQKNPTAGGGGNKGGPKKGAKITKKVWICSCGSFKPTILRRRIKPNILLPQFIINATQPVNDRIFDASAFTTFLQQRIKVDGLTGNLGERINVTNLGDGRIEVVAHQEFSGRYLKYLTKKFLKKQQLRDWLRVVATNKGEYTLKFFNVVGEEGEEEED
jgi:large subunit ribosomal protein L22e